MSEVDPKNPKYSLSLQRLLGIMNDLREKCPWDRKQTFDSIRPLTIEETYELSAAIFAKDPNEIRKELGDLMLHIVFYAKMGAEQDSFDLADVLNGVCDKLVSRHPHVYGDVKAEDEATVKRNWELLKLKEKDRPKGVLSGVPQSLPALIKAWRIQQKVKGVGFEWANREDVWHKVQEEINEFKAHIDQQGEKITDPIAAEDEFGDILFSLINYARFIGIEPETALEKTNRKFIQRFQHLEQAIETDGKNWENIDLAEMEQYWLQAKQAEKDGITKP